MGKTRALFMKYTNKTTAVKLNPPQTFLFLPFGRLAEEYGPMYSVQLGRRRVVVLNSSQWLTQAFVRQGDKFNHRPRGTVLSFIMGGKGESDG